MKRDALLICLIGPTGAGKTTYARKLSDDPDLKINFSISATSREPRTGEVNGDSYYFYSNKDFEKMISEGKFIEFEKVHGNYYGTLKDTVDQCIIKGQDLIFDIDINGALNLKKIYPHHVKIIFLIPPSPRIMFDRLKNRGQMSDQERKVRIETAKWEYSQLFENKAVIDFFVVNKDIDSVYKKLFGIILSESNRLYLLDEELLKSLCRLPKIEK